LRIRIEVMPCVDLLVPTRSVSSYLYSLSFREEVFSETKQFDKREGRRGEEEGGDEKGLRPLMRYPSSIGPHRGESVARKVASIHELPRRRVLGYSEGREGTKEGPGLLHPGPLAFVGLVL
jgi:hypothetical protein